MAAVLSEVKSRFQMALRFCKAIFSAKRAYQFSFADLWYGALLQSCGYGHVMGLERVLTDDGKFLEIALNDTKIAVSKGVFKPGELAWLYQEVFEPYPRNPHVYFRGAVRVAPGDVVIDAGACEGFFVMQALEAGCSHVYAFEPVKVLTEGLTRTFAGNDRVELVSAGLSDTKGRAKISLGKAFICEAKIDSSGSEEIALTTIDAFVQARGLTNVDFIKMDIEGAEIKAIQGAEEVLRRFAPKLAIAVYHEYETAERLKALILQINPDYCVAYGGCYMYEKPFRPFMVYAMSSQGRKDNKGLLDK